MTVVPGRPDQAGLSDVAEPLDDEGSVLLETLVVGLCGTDAEIVEEGVGYPPPGADALVLGHEAVARVLAAPASSGLAPGDLVTGIVRQPCPARCPACARGEWDYCSSGTYTEHGIRGSAGFGRERWRSEPAYLVPVPEPLGELGVLVEPMSVVCKALETARHVAARAYARPARVLVTGAGPIGLLAAGAAAASGFEVTVLDRMRTGVKPTLAAKLGAAYTDDLDALGGIDTDDIFTANGGAQFDVVLECSGATGVIARAATTLGQNGVMVLIGIAGHGSDRVQLGMVTNALIRSNGALVGTVNAGRRHYADAVDTLLRLDREWLTQLITRRVALEQWPTALTRSDDDVKVVVQFPAR